MKKCTECKKEKSIKDFYTYGKGRRRSKCKECFKTKVTEWRHKTGRSKTRVGQPRVNLLGQQIGILEVIQDLGVRPIGSKNKLRRYWLCQCKCGNKKEVEHSHLRSGNIKSCGCEQYKKGGEHHSWTGHGEISGNTWDHIKRKRRNSNKRKFTITIEYAWQLFLDQNRCCVLTNLPLSFGKPKTACLDRIDSSKGYSKGNVQWIHKDVNWMKNAFSQDYFIHMCQLVTEQHQQTI